MHFERNAIAMIVLACLGGCGGFERGKPSGAACVDGPSVFEDTVYPVLDASCSQCHTASGLAGGTRYVLTGDAAADYDVVQALVDPSAPEASLLLKKGTGQGHGGGSPLTAGSQDYEAILKWIRDGAERGGSGCDGSQMDAGPTPDATPEDANGSDVDAGPTDDAMVQSDATMDARVDADQGETGTPDADQQDAMPDAGPPVSFADDVRMLLLSDCEVCHNPDGVASSTELRLGGSADEDLAAVLMFVDVDDPGGSKLLAKVRGEAHGGGERFAEDSEQYTTILAWIEGGAAP